MITIYHLVRSRSERIIWLMEELGEPYDLAVFERTPAGEAPPEYRAIHPMGTAPIIRDGDLMLVETGAIIEYILGRYGNGRLVPKPGTPEHGRYLLWMHFAEGTAAFGILTEALLQMQSNTIGKPNRFQKLWRERNDRMIPYLEQELSQRAYFAGPEFTGADIMMAYNFNMFERFLRPLTDCKHIKDYCARVFSRPAYAKAMEISLPGGDMANPDPFASRKP